MFARTITPARIRASIGICAALALLSAPQRAFPSPAATDACAMVTAADAAPLVGASPTRGASSNASACMWKGADGKRKLSVLVYKTQGPSTDMMFKGARMNAQKEADGVFADEAGVGDKAFSGQVSFGAVFIVEKHARMFQLQYYTGGRGTAKDVAALRPLAKKLAAGL